MNKLPFPKAIDSTLRASFVACPRKFQLQYLEHWKKKRTSVHLVAGGAFAEGMDVTRTQFATGDTPEQALAAGAKALIRKYGDFEAEDDHNKSLANMVAALGESFAHHGFSTDPLQPHILPNGKPAVEFSFAIPISEDLLHPETGDPILYTGRFDMLGEMQDNLWVVDDKTTGYIGKQWFNQWTLRSQLTGYCWAAREYGYPVVGAIIRGLAIRKKDFGHAESIQYRPDWMITRWHMQLQRDIQRMIRSWEEGYFDYTLDGACSDYGGCDFLEVCSSPNPERWLATDFEQRIWDPLAREERPLND